MFENITNLALGYNFNKYTDLYSGYTKEWTKPTEENIRKEICKYYLINYAGWSASEAEVGARGFAPQKQWSLQKMIDDMEKCKAYRENWNSGVTNVAAWWRSDNWTPLFFPKLDMSNVQNAERCWHSNYNCWFYPSVDLPLCTNAAGMFYYQDCQWICGDINLPSLTTVGSNRFIFYLTRLRDKITINLPNLTSMVNGLLQSNALDYVPTINAPHLAKCAYMLFRGVNFLKNNDVIRELGPNMNWSGCTDFRWMCYQTSGVSKFDISLIDFSSAQALTSMFYNSSTGLTIEFPQTLNLPVAEAINYMFCSSAVKIVGNINCPNVWDVEALFAGAETLEEIGTVYCGKVIDFEYIFEGCTALKNIGGLTDLGATFTTATTQEKRTLTLSDSPLLTRESVLNIINSVATLSETEGHIVLHSDVYDQLTDADKDLATSKGWVVETA